MANIFMKKKFVFIIIILVCLFNVWVSTVIAAESSFFQGLRATAEQGAGYQSMPKGGANRFISIILGRGIWPVLIGVMGTLLLCYGGFIWMMSRGREQEIERAKIIVTNTLIAMVVIFLAWAIVMLIMPLWKLVTGKLSGV